MYNEESRVGPPAPPEADTPRPIPGLPLLAAAAGTGLVLSVVAHVAAIRGLPQPLGESTMMLHAASLLALAAAAFASRGLPADVEPKRRGLAFWSALPAWARRTIQVLFAYVFLNIVLCHGDGAGGIIKPRFGEEPPPAVVRSFSGHWMFFFGTAIVIFLAVPSVAARGRDAEARPQPKPKPRGDFDEWLG